MSTPVPLHCPHCSAALRVQDRALIGREVRCPDCGGALRVVADGPRNLSIQKGEERPSQPPRHRPGKRPRRSSPAAPERRTDASAAQQASESPARQSAARRSQVAPSAVVADATDRERGPGESADSARQSALGWASRVSHPTRVAWGVAGALVLALCVFLLWPAGGPDAGASGSPSGMPDPSPPASHVAAPADVPPAVPLTDADVVRERLTRLGERLAEYREQHGHFPGTRGDGAVPPEERFGWLAELESAPRRRGAGEPLWDRPWHDPLNEPFVRRALPALQNPAIAQKAGRNRYPASHFAGVAGVGPDAPELPADHPRAGVFGYSRRTRLEDIRDGAAHTIAVGGVRGELESWASASGTIRPFTTEPYVNGPDGFGTGQPDGMLVLMADGSVRSVSKETDPRIVRRMATIASGLPLDPDVPGEPGDPAPRSPAPSREPERPEDPPLAHRDPPEAPEPDAPFPNGRDAQAPGEAELPVAAPDPPSVPVQPPRRIDVAGALEQKIAGFEHRRPVPFREALWELEEMTGVAIHYDAASLEAPDGLLDTPVSLRLTNTTVGGILQALVDRVELTYEIEPDGIRLRRAGAERDEGSTDSDF